MKLLLPLLTLLAAAPLTRAQDPAAPAPATPAPAAGATAPAAADAKLSSSEQKFVRDSAGSLQLLMKLSNTARYKKGTSIETLGTNTSKDLTGLWTPLAGFGVDKIPTEIDKGDKQVLERLNKNKEDKWALEFLELAEKTSKRAAKDYEAGSKSIHHPGLKAWGENAAAVLKAHATNYEAAYKEAKEAGKKK